MKPRPAPPRSRAAEGERVAAIITAAAIVGILFWCAVAHIVIGAIGGRG